MTSAAPGCLTTVAHRLSHEARFSYDSMPADGSDHSAHVLWRLGVAGCFLDELYAAGEAEFGVDVGEVGLDGAR
jgi:hypothetical protein